MQHPKVAIALVSLSALFGCVSTPQSRDVDPTAIQALTQARVIVLAPTSAALNGASRTDHEVNPLSNPGSAPGLTPIQASTPYGTVGSGIATGLLMAIAGRDAAEQRKESQRLLANNGRIPNQEIAQLVLLAELRARSKIPAPIQIVEVGDITAETSSLQTIKGNQSAALVKITLTQSMSSDLARLRVHAKINALRSDGSTLMEQNVFYLPISIPGATAADSLNHWTQDNYKLYREHLDTAAIATVDALDALFFSRSKFTSDFQGDAHTVLQRTNCFGGDYDAGIPFSAYKSGKVLPSHPQIVLTRLENGDVLAFPKCDR